MQNHNVITYGTFDLFHVGHVNLLRRARSFGSRLIVGLSTDEFNKGKGKVCVMPYEQRKIILESIKYVDLVIPENSWDQKSHDVEEFGISTFVIGNDWEGKFDFLKSQCKVCYLKRTDDISTTKFKKEIGFLNRQHMADMINALRAASDLAESIYGSKDN